MATTEELEKEILAEMAADPMAYAAGPVNDVITIDGETRVISVPASELLFGVETDKDVERKHFRCPRVVGDGIDLSKHQIYISYITSDSTGKSFSGDSNLYLCEDVAVDGDDITFSWQLSGNVFASAGFIAFKVLAAKTDGENVQTRWNTVPAVGTVLMTVPDGIDISETYPDIVTQLLERMASVEKIATEEAMQGYVNTYLEVHPAEIDETLTDPKKAAPASVVGELKEDLVDLQTVNIIYTNNKLDTSENNVKIGAGVKSGGGNCFNIETCINANDTRVVFLTPIEIENGKIYKLCNDNSNTGTIYTVAQYFGVYDSKGDYLTRVDGRMGFSINGKLFRNYTNTSFNKYVDYELSDIGKYVLISSTIDNYKNIKQLRVVDFEDEQINDYIPYQCYTVEENTRKIKECVQKVDRNTEIINSLISKGFRVILASDLHFDAENPNAKIAGIRSRDRMQMFVDAVNAENRIKNVDALIFLGDFELGYGKKSATYFAKHYAPQLEMPFYAFPGDHDFYTNEEWKNIWGRNREDFLDVGDMRFIFVDVYKNTIGQKDSDGHTVLSVLDEDVQQARVQQALEAGKKAVLMAHWDGGLIRNDITTSTWRNFMRNNVTAVFCAHTHTPSVSNNGYGELYYYNTGNFSYPPNADFAKIDDGDGTAWRRYSLRNLEIGDNCNTKLIYPHQKLLIEEVEKEWDYTLGDEYVIRTI